MLRCGNILRLKIRFLDVVKFTIFVQTLIPNCWFENVFPTFFDMRMYSVNDGMHSGILFHFGGGGESQIWASPLG
jgi:hypothetical protein